MNSGRYRVYLKEGVIHSQNGNCKAKDRIKEGNYWDCDTIDEAVSKAKGALKNKPRKRYRFCAICDFDAATRDEHQQE